MVCDENNNKLVPQSKDVVKQLQFLTLERSNTL